MNREELIKAIVAIENARDYIDWGRESMNAGRNEESNSELTKASRLLEIEIAKLRKVYEKGA